MYFARIELNKRRRGAQKLLGSPQAMHAAVLSSFPAERTSGRVLWRVDVMGESTLLYVVAPNEPDLTHIVEQAGWPTTQAWAVRDYRPVLDQLTAGQRWGFRLKANPTKSVALPPRKGEDVGEGPDAVRPRSSRVGHVTAEQQRQWFLDRVSKWGIEIPTRTYQAGQGEAEAAHIQTVQVVRRGVETFRRGGAHVTLSTAVFDGELVVVDATALREALTAGIGPAKGYGCGLLTLAPLATHP